MGFCLVGDLQIPYHDKRAVSLFFKAMKAWRPDAIDVVGDIDDQLEYSRFSDGTTDEFFSQLKATHKAWEKERDAEEKKFLKSLENDDYKHESLAFEFPGEPSRDPLPFVMENARGARSFYEDLRAQHPNANIHASLGNHDIRVFDYMDRKSPEHNEFLTPNALWGLDDQGITWRMYHEKPLMRFAGIHVHHGTTALSTGLSVRGDIENYNISLVRGHDHKGGVVYKSYPLSGTNLMGMGCGHLCDPDQYGLRYTINPEWEQGFGIGHVVDGKPYLQFIPIVDYTCVIDGKVVKG